MATKTICFPSVRCETARFTALDRCGKPLPGLCATIVTDDIVSVKATAEVDEGEEISVKNFAGRLAVSEKPPKIVKWFNIEIILAKIMPALLAMTSNYETVVNDVGGVIGYDVGSNVDGNTGLELWGAMPGVACGTGEFDVQFAHLTFPWIGGMSYTGDLMVENNAMQPTLSGTTKTGHGWGVGPYMITKDSLGNPSPNFTPIAPDKHFRHQVVYLDAPVPACECVELPVPALAAAAVETVPHAADRRQVTLTWDNSVDGQVEVLWKAAAAPVIMPAAGSVEHTYLAADDGPIVITVTSVATPLRTKAVPIVIPYVGL